MDKQELDNLLSEWEGTWSSPGWRSHLKTIGLITLALALLLGAVHLGSTEATKVTPSQIEANF